MLRSPARQAKNPIRITDTTFRDAHQSVAATRMRTADMALLAPEMDKIGFHSMEVWGGATFDVATRFLAEDPWDRVRVLKQLMPHTPLQMLLRGQNLVGYRNYPDDVVQAFVSCAAEAGIDIFRIFDALNDERNLEVALDEVRKAGKHAQACICYSVTEERHLGGPVYTLEYYLQKARLLQEMGADSLCIKDMAGLLAPYDAQKLVRALKRELRIPIQLHTHYSSGMASMTCLASAEAGVDVIDVCLSPFALRTSQPAVEPLVFALQGTQRDTGLDLDHLVRLSSLLETQIAPKYREFMDHSRASVIDIDVLSHQIPGGMASNLVIQLREAGALDRLEEVLQEIPRTRKEMGYPPLVTPTSQIVATQAIQNVLFGRYNMIASQVKDYVYGLYGRPPAPIEPWLVEKALKDYSRGQKPITGRGADVLPPELEQVKEQTKGLARNMGDILICALYPTTGQRFLRWKYGLEAPPPESRPKTLEEARDEEEAASEARRGLTEERPSQPAPGSRNNSWPKAFDIHVGGEYFRVEVQPVAPVEEGAQEGQRPAPAPVKEPPQPKGTPLRAPMPGIVVRYPIQIGQRVKRGDTVVVIEAMKMENALPAPADGVVQAILFNPGDKVARGDILVTIG